MSALFTLILILMAGVLIVLSLGIGRYFGREGLDNAKRSNKMMQLRIALQAAAVLMILFFAYLKDAGGGP